MTLAAYRKAIAMVAFAVIGAVIAHLGDGKIATVEWVYIAITGVTAAQVFAAPNVPGAAYTKAIVAGLGTILSFLVGALDGGISAPEWAQIASIAAGTAFVFLVPNEPLPGGLAPSQPVHPLPPEI
jgi:hypothetical protein